jgi:DNA-binding Lrp family transcriptional regulator|tara:strand:+ start:4085 stop:4660 length:576 start_codon:yes stop_codon:yes gene_type:complete
MEDNYTNIPDSWVKIDEKYRLLIAIIKRFSSKGKTFFMANKTVTEKYGIPYMTVRRRMQVLEDNEIIKFIGWHASGTKMYKIDEDGLGFAIINGIPTKSIKANTDHSVSDTDQSDSLHCSNRSTYTDHSDSSTVQTDQHTIRVPVEVTNRELTIELPEPEDFLCKFNKDKKEKEKTKKEIDIALWMSTELS